MNAPVTNLAVAASTPLRPLSLIGERLRIPSEALLPWGRHAAKIEAEAIPAQGRGRLVLVTAMNPTPAGEGKTTTAIGIAQGLTRRGVRACVALREPSLGPVFGMKGGGCGGGFSQILPMEDINLHFTGDLAAITSAHNLLAAMLDNHLHHGNALGLDIRDILWPRVMDMNDRALRGLVLGLGGRNDGIPRQGRFDITAASEVMAIMALASDLPDLKARLARIVVGFSAQGKPITALDLHATGAMALLLRDALLPNLVQTVEGTPAIVHCGPFGNIAHGCSSLRGTQLSMRLADITITEAGFGADLGAQKFLDIVCPLGGFWPDVVVLVGTIRAAKYHGGVPIAALTSPDHAALLRGMDNLFAHAEALKNRGLSVVIALNQRADDPTEEAAIFLKACQEAGWKATAADPFSKGGEGCLATADAIQEAMPAQTPTPFHPYAPNDPFREKLRKVLRFTCGAREVVLTPAAEASLKRFEAAGFGLLPPCIARTQYSLSDNPKALGRPKDFEVTIREIRLSAGAGFLVALAGEIMTMPGLAKEPAAHHIGIDDNGHPYGIF